MADTRVQIEVEDWVRNEWMRKAFGQKFHRDRVRLTPGRVFDFDAVSEDNTIVAGISTGTATTSRGKHAVGKLSKIRSDMFFLLLVADVKRRMIVLTERDMFELLTKERESGRVPLSIEFVHAEIPESLREKLIGARRAASQEVSPESP